MDGDGRLFWRVDRPAGLGTIRKKAGTPAGWLSCSGYWVVWLDGVNIQGHQAVWALTRGEWPQALIDHKDRDRANNRPDNLRLATKSQNSANTAKRRGNGPRGVAKVVGCERWAAKIAVNGKQIYLGIFKSPEEASSAYEKAAREIRGEFYVQPQE